MVGLAAGVHIYAANVPGIESGEQESEKIDFSNRKKIFVYIRR